MKVKNGAWALLMGLLIAAVTTTAFAAENRRDGNWWSEQDRDSKVFYLTGFFDGMDLGKDFSVWKYIHSGSKADESAVAKVTAAYKEYSNKYFNNVTAGQLVGGLNTFYSDYRNRRIKVFAAVWLVVQGIAGTPPEELEKSTESWRRNSAD